MNRKALSPLSSTVILLVISIIIGVIVMTWGRGYVEKATTTVPEAPAVEKEQTLFEDLNARLERGEISMEQYEKIKEVLMRNS